jgi:hypothetical protein
MKQSCSLLQVHLDDLHIAYIGLKRTLDLGIDPGISEVVDTLRGSKQPFSTELRLVPFQIFIYQRRLSLPFPPQPFS